MSSSQPGETPSHDPRDVSSDAGDADLSPRDHPGANERDAQDQQLADSEQQAEDEVADEELAEHDEGEGEQDSDDWEEDDEDDVEDEGEDDEENVDEGYEDDEVEEPVQDESEPALQADAGAEQDAQLESDDDAEHDEDDEDDELDEDDADDEDDEDDELDEDEFEEDDLGEESDKAEEAEVEVEAVSVSEAATVQAVEATESEPAEADQNVAAVASLHLPAATPVELPGWTDPPRGLSRGDSRQRHWIDAMAGRVCSLGFGHPAIQSVIQASADDYLGDASAHRSPLTSPPLDPSAPRPASLQPDHSDLPAALRQLAGSTGRDLTESIWLCESAALAVEQAIGIARAAGRSDAQRIVALVGSDHGRTAMTRIASGRPALHGSGVMMAGFAHAPLGDIDALRKTVDDSTAAVLISPLLWHHGAQILNANYLNDIRRLCDERDVLLIADETQIVFGSAAKFLATWASAEIRVDIAVLAAGLFSGLPGGITLASRRAVATPVVDCDAYPLSSAVATATLQAMQRNELPDAAEEPAREFVVEFAEQVSSYAFVRDVQVLGFSIGLETDLPAEDVVRFAAAQGLRLETAGETSVRMQPPVVMSADDRQQLLQRLSATLAAIESETTQMSV